MIAVNGRVRRGPGRAARGRSAGPERAVLVGTGALQWARLARSCLRNRHIVTAARRRAASGCQLRPTVSAEPTVNTGLVTSAKKSSRVPSAP